MTTRHHARPADPERVTGRGGEPERRPTAPGESLAERFVAAREAKGVDLLRAERETRIRRTYLSALEHGSYAELPSGVYARGFVRNYATYLGLDPDEAIAQYGREQGPIPATDPILAMPKGLEAPRRTINFTPGILVAALVTLAALGIVAYIGFQLVRFSEPPPLLVTDPPTAIIDVPETATTYAIRGTTVANGEVEIQAPGRDTVQVTAGPDGAWTATVLLRRGKNQFLVNATDPKTSKQADNPVQLVITVPVSQVLAPSLAVDSPADGAQFQNGALPISGTATNATSVTVSAAWIGPAPNQAAPASAAPTPKPPAPVAVTPANDGTFSSSLDLTAGRWAVSITASSDPGKTTTLTRSVTVVYQGVNLVVQVKGGRAWMKVWVDGKVSTQTGSAGVIVNDGQTVTFTAKTSVEVRTGNAGVTFYTLNGTELGTKGPAGSPETWLFKPPDPPKRTNRQN